MIGNYMSLHILGKNFSRLLILVCAVGWGAASAQQQQPRPAEQVQIRTIPVANGFYVLTGRGTNTGVSAGEDGAVLVNAGFAQVQPQIVGAIARLTSKPIRLIINTDWHDPNTSGNALMAKLGAVIVAHANVRKRLSVERIDTGNANMKIPPYPKEGLPAVTYRDD